MRKFLLTASACALFAMSATARPIDGQTLSIDRPGGGQLMAHLPVGQPVAAALLLAGGSGKGAMPSSDVLAISRMLVDQGIAVFVAAGDTGAGPLPDVAGAVGAIRGAMGESRIGVVGVDGGAMVALAKAAAAAPDFLAVVVDGVRSSPVVNSKAACDGHAVPANTDVFVYTTNTPESASADCLLSFYHSIKRTKRTSEIHIVSDSAAENLGGRPGRWSELVAAWVSRVGGTN